MSQIIVGSNGGGGGGGTTSFQTDAGTATPVAGVIQILGDVDITTSGAGNVITVTGAIATALDFDADTGTATPVGNTINIVGGTNVTTSATGSTVTINATAALMPWTEITTPTVNLAINNGYKLNATGGCQGTLPAVAPLGSIVRCIGNNDGNSFTIFPNVGQSILSFGNGVASTQAETMFPRYSIEFICITANTEWLVTNMTGTFDF